MMAPMGDDRARARCRQMARSLRAEAEAMRGIEETYGLIVATDALKAARQRGRLLAVEWGGRLIFPGFQFDEYGQVRPVMAGLLTVSAAAGYDAMSLLIFLCAPSTYVVDDAAPVSLITEPERLIDMTERALGVEW